MKQVLRYRSAVKFINKRCWIISLLTMAGSRFSNTVTIFRKAGT